MIERIIPSTGEALPVLGIGTWKTFDAADEAPLERLFNVLKIMRQEGGRLIDTSPMYGSAEQVIGELTDSPDLKNHFFYATKVWIEGKEAGILQIENSFEKMKRDIIDLVQIHNLVDWKTHLSTLKDLKSEARIRYTGITHYKDIMHLELERILTEEHFDFVQFNYSVSSRNAETRLLDVCADLGTAVIINRPFGEGKLFTQVKEKPLPEWASGLQINNWSEYFLKYIMSHPAVTCIIPATGNPDHAAENFGLLRSKLPGTAERKKMAEYIDSIIE